MLTLMEARMVYWYDYDYKVVPSRDFSPGEIFWVNRIGCAVFLSAVIRLNLRALALF